MCVVFSIYLIPFLGVSEENITILTMAQHLTQEAKQAAKRAAAFEGGSFTFRSTTQSKELYETPSKELYDAILGAARDAIQGLVVHNPRTCTAQSIQGGSSCTASNDAGGGKENIRMPGLAGQSRDQPMSPHLKIIGNNPISLAVGVPLQA